MSSSQRTIMVVLSLFAAAATASFASEGPRQLTAAVYRHAEADTATGTYRLQAGSLVDMHGSRELDARELEFARRALAGMGLHESADGHAAEMEIEISVSIYGRMKPAADANERFRPVTHQLRRVTVLEEGEDGAMIRGRAQVIVPANHRYTRASPPIARKETYDKTLQLSARTPRGSDPRAVSELWRAEVRNSDACDSPREFLPYLLSAAVDALQSRESRRLDLVLRANDPRVRRVADDS